MALGGFEGTLIEMAGREPAPSKFEEAVGGFSKGIGGMANQYMGQQSLKLDRGFLDQMATEAEIDPTMHSNLMAFARTPEQMRGVAESYAQRGMIKNIERKGLEYLQGVQDKVQSALSDITDEQFQSDPKIRENVFNQVMEDVKRDASMNLGQDVLSFVGPRIGLNQKTGDGWLDYQMKNLDLKREEMAFRREKEERLKQNFGANWNAKAMQYADKAIDADQRAALTSIANTANALNELTERESSLAFLPLSNSKLGSDFGLWISGAANRGVLKNKKVEEWRKAKQKADTIIGNFMAQYMKATSGLTVTDTERRFLRQILALGNNASYGDFLYAFNHLRKNLISEHAANMNLSTQFADYVGADVDGYMDELRKIGNIPPVPFDEGSITGQAESLPDAFDSELDNMSRTDFEKVVADKLSSLDININVPGLSVSTAGDGEGLVKRVKRTAKKTFDDAKASMETDKPGEEQFDELIGALKKWKLNYNNVQGSGSSKEDPLMIADAFYDVKDQRAAYESVPEGSYFVVLKGGVPTLFVRRPGGAVEVK